jgi:hypothetical protein
MKSLLVSDLLQLRTERLTTPLIIKHLCEWREKHKKNERKIQGIIKTMVLCSWASWLTKVPTLVWIKDEAFIMSLKILMSELWLLSRQTDPAFNLSPSFCLPLQHRQKTTSPPYVARHRVPHKIRRNSQMVVLFSSCQCKMPFYSPLSLSAHRWSSSYLTGCI